MTHSLKLALAGAALATVLAAGVGFAQAPPPPNQPPAVQGQDARPGRGDRPDRSARMARMCERAPAMLAGMLAYTENRLKLTAEQQPLWTAFANDARTAAQPMQRTCNEVAQNPPDPTSLSARLTRAERMANATSDAIRTVRPALDRLEAALTPEQRQTLAGIMNRRGGMGFGRGGHHGGPMGFGRG